MILGKEKIKMRALKEEILTSPSAIGVPVDFYQHALEISLKSLSELERRVLYLRFWEPLPIARVADLTGLSWEYADCLIDIAVTKLRKKMSQLLKERISK